MMFVLAPLAAGTVTFGRRLIVLLLDVTGIVPLTPVIAVLSCCSHVSAGVRRFPSPLGRSS
ncbi:hypothetical protein [Streptomyces sp. NPDC002521]